VTGLLLALLLPVADPGKAFAVAIAGGDSKAVAALLDAGHPADTPTGEDGATPLQMAAWKGRTAIAKLLLERGADVNAAPGSYGTALAAAVSQGWDDLVAVLLEAGAEVDARDDRGGRPLHNAVSSGNRDLAGLLLKAGAKLEESAPGYTPLMYAAMGDDAEMVRLLVKAGARPDSPAKGEYGGRNPLLIAAENGRAEALKALLELKANPNARTSEGETALDLAQAAGHAEIVTLLKAAGARPGKPAGRKP
jgi:ankyrin repeat protein